MSGIEDSYHRRINYMRISVTDRCNLNCMYCNNNAIPHLNHDDILRYEEIHRIIQVAAELGVNKIRLTGGEPLVRLNLSHLVELLIAVNGIDEVTLTTNGTLLEKYAVELKEAGLKRVNVSLDTFKPDRFRQITGSDKLEDVLRGIETARKAGLNPVKINMVVLRGVNDDEILDFARMTVSHGWHVRYIEHMPFAGTWHEDKQIVSIAEITESINQSLGELQPVSATYGNGPAKYYRLPDSEGTIGFIGAVTECFCAECNRFRLTADGKLRPCLLDDDEIDIRTPLRNGATREELKQLIHDAAILKQKQHHLAEESIPANRSMRQIGG